MPVISTENQLDELHVVSDLHLGGVEGHQIFNQGPALAALIDHLRAAPAGRRVGLALNGDIVDFLADRNAAYLDPLGAATKLRVIFDDPAFRPVWDALARFTRTPDRVLALVVGNHDVELALPDVTAVLIDRLCGEDEEARARVRVAMDGHGYTCEVGGQRVLCVHGNQADPWNPVDFEALGKVRDAVAAKRSPPRWDPNAGTRLVVDVMNAVKMDFAFVDLLKPETAVVPAVLLAVAIEHEAPLAKFARVVLRRVYDEGRLVTGFLGGKEPGELTDARAIELLVRPSTWQEPSGRRAPAWEGIDWLRQATEDDAKGHRPVDLVDVSAGETLGFGGLVLDRLRGSDPRENLREALVSFLERDQSFDLAAEDDTFQKLDGHPSAASADCVIAGHTHLARRLLRRRGRGVYFNTGTWIRLIQLTPPMLTPEGFQPVYKALRAGTLEALDSFPGLVQQRRTVASIWAGADGLVHGELRSALEAPGDGAPPRGPPWEPVEGTRYDFPRARGASPREPRQPAPPAAKETAP